MTGSNGRHTSRDNVWGTMKTQRDRVRGALLTLCFALAILLIPRIAFAEVTYGPNTVRSGFGYTFTGNTFLDINGNTANGGVRLISSSPLYWDAPLIKCEMYWMQLGGWELISARPLSSAAGSGLVWTGTTPSFTAPEAKLTVQGEIICYNPTYTTRVDFWPAPHSGQTQNTRDIPTRPDTIPPSNPDPYFVNASGQTYGSNALKTRVGYSPVLILARGDNGMSGYIYSSDLDRLDSYGLENKPLPDDMKVISVYKNNSSQWAWIRVTTINGSNYNMGDRTKLTAPYGIVSGLPYGTGDNWSVGSQRCSAAISIGWPTSTISVTYEGAASGSYASQTVYIYPGGSVQ